MSEEGKKHVSIAICGTVDSGKSTTTGHLIYALGGIPEREMQKLKDEAARVGKASFEFAFYMDRQKDERERGITIVTTVKEFFTPNYHFSVSDNPGHRDYIKNMITGSSQADSALLLVPCDGNFEAAIAKENRAEGITQGQSRQHARLLNLLGVKQLIVGLNKMDSEAAKFSQERYTEVRDETKRMLIQVGWNKKFVEENVAFIPYSGYKGDNLIKKSENMPWWNGVDVKALDDSTAHIVTIFDALDKYIKIPPRKDNVPYRVPISGVHNIKGVGMIVTGRVEQGVVNQGDEVVFVPTHTASNPCTGKVFSIEMHHRSIPKAETGDNVGMSIKGLNKDYLPKPGDIMILKKDTSLAPVKQFTAQVQVLDHPGELKPGYTPIVFCRTAKCACRMEKINWKMGKETGGKKVENPVSLKSNEMAEVVFKPMQPFTCEAFSKFESGLARIALMDSNSAVMLGKVTAAE